MDYLLGITQEERSGDLPADTLADPVTDAPVRAFFISLLFCFKLSGFSSSFPSEG